jgi:hypothetical protein
MFPAGQAVGLRPDFHRTPEALKEKTVSQMDDPQREGDMPKPDGDMPQPGSQPGGDMPQPGCLPGGGTNEPRNPGDQGSM